MFMKLNEDEKLAEMVGIFRGACIINDNHLIISIDKTREKIIDYVSQLIEAVVKVKPRKETNGNKTKLIVNNPEAVNAFESSWRRDELANCFFLYV